ncbi:MAG: anti-sigma factor [Nocardioidaceae bacterium]
MTDIHSLAHAYVVDALDADEAREFERHLASCAACTQEVAELREVTAALSTQTATEPPSAVRARVLDAISRTSQEPAASRLPHAAEPPHEAQPAKSPDGVPASVTPIAVGEPIKDAGASRRSDRARATRFGHPRRWSVGLVAASLVAAVGLGVWAIQSRQDLDDSRREAQTAAAQADQLARVLAADDVQMVRGRYTDGGSGVVVMSAAEGAAMLVGRDLPALPDDKVYEAWTIEGDPVPADPMPAGTFTPEGGQSMLELPSATFDAETVAVTVEPEGGSDAPTSDAVFSVVMPG